MNRALKLKPMEIAPEPRVELKLVPKLSSDATTVARDTQREVEAHQAWGLDYVPRLRLVPPLAREVNPTPEPTGAGATLSNPTHIWFNWNGHSWCAFEVLGVPQASSVAVAQEAFRGALSKTDLASQPFLNEAIQAIERCCK